MKILMLYYLFAKISVFTFGGGYAMIPLFQDELVTKGHFLNDAEFANMVALAQITPGPVGLNAATYIGYDQAGILGAIMGNLGLMTPSLVITMLAAIFLSKTRNNKILEAALSGIRPAILGLIAAAVIFFANSSVFANPINNLWKQGANFSFCWQGTLIFIATIAIQLKWKLNMIWMLIIAAFMGWILFLL